MAAGRRGAGEGGVYWVESRGLWVGSVDLGTIDVGAPALTPDRAACVEDRCAEIVAQARPVSVTYEDSAAVSGLRKESQRAGILRIVSIADVDRSAGPVVADEFGNLLKVVSGKFGPSHLH